MLNLQVVFVHQFWWVSRSFNLLAVNYDYAQEARVDGQQDAENQSGGKKGDVGSRIGSLPKIEAPRQEQGKKRCVRPRFRTIC
jgi:hypothetical protein